MGHGLSNIALTVGQSTKGSSVADVIEFCESTWGIRLHLLPVQRVILKAHYGIPLDTTRTFRVAKDWRQEEFWDFTEADYLRFLFEEGRSNIKEVDHGRPELVLAIGRRAGKCVREGSLVLTDKGIVPIESLGDPSGPEVQPCETVVAQEGQKKSRSAYFYNGGIRDTVRVRTRCGYEEEGTPNHRIQVLSENNHVHWKYLEDVKVGDVACLHRGTNLWATEKVDHTNSSNSKEFCFPNVLDARWGLFLGYMEGILMSGMT